ncbi:hypothetical protein HPB49_012791 [Dermacentor silvarum]|uniref:Uncharacterized protein n=1 Tax=Dermacentor silvarum TaxID=543639 RepID=A0ACB8CRI6_DERSI|nr:hypothetical protein HPB49_012791 [Dermacentor silvarum]
MPSLARTRLPVVVSSKRCCCGSVGINELIYHFISAQVEELMCAGTAKDANRGLIGLADDGIHLGLICMTNIDTIVCDLVSRIVLNLVLHLRDLNLDDTIVFLRKPPALVPDLSSPQMGEAVVQHGGGQRLPRSAVMVFDFAKREAVHLESAQVEELMCAGTAKDANRGLIGLADDGIHLGLICMTNKLVWSYVNGFMASENYTSKLQDVEPRVWHGIMPITTEKWNSYVEHVLNEEVVMRKLDHIIGDVVDHCPAVTVNLEDETMNSADLSCNEDDEM